MEQPKSTFSLLLDDATLLVEKKTALIRLTMAEKVVDMSSSFGWAVVAFMTCFITLIFVSITAAWWLGERLGSIPLGFSILSLLYVVISIGVFFFWKKSIEEAIANGIIKKLVHDN
jgi:hypothetical protein